MLAEIMRVVDSNRDGKIQYEGMFINAYICCAWGQDLIRIYTEFRTFMEATERQLLYLFKSIDRNQDGKVEREELEFAFRKAGLAVPKRRLAGFFEQIDMNRDGFISFDEWR